MTDTQIPKWLSVLSEEELHFIKRFVLASGSLKDLAKQYKVSYPTLRIRLNRLIEKIEIADDSDKENPFLLKNSVDGRGRHIDTSRRKSTHQGL